MPASLRMMAFVRGYASMTAFTCWAAAAASEKSARDITGTTVCSLPPSSCGTQAALTHHGDTEAASLRLSMHDSAMHSGQAHLYNFHAQYRPHHAGSQLPIRSRQADMCTLTAAFSKVYQAFL